MKFLSYLPLLLAAPLTSASWLQKRTYNGTTTDAKGMKDKDSSTGVTPSPTPATTLSYPTCTITRTGKYAEPTSNVDADDDAAPDTATAKNCPAVLVYKNVPGYRNQCTAPPPNFVSQSTIPGPLTADPSIMCSALCDGAGSRCRAYFWTADPSAGGSCYFYDRHIASPAKTGKPCTQGSGSIVFSQGFNRVCSSNIDNRCAAGSTYTNIPSLTGQYYTPPPPCPVPTGYYDRFFGVSNTGLADCQAACDADGKYCTGIFNTFFKYGYYYCALYHTPINPTCNGNFDNFSATSGYSKNCFCKKK